MNAALSHFQSYLPRYKQAYTELAAMRERVVGYLNNGHPAAVQQAQILTEHGAVYVQVLITGVDAYYTIGSVQPGRFPEVIVGFDAAVKVLAEWL